MQRRGIVLVISIVVAAVMLMFIGAAIGLGPANLQAGQSTVYRDAAQRAAESGVQYALSQLHKDPTWRGNLNGITVNTPDLWVVEDNGNVIGLLTTPDGARSQFRLRFNYNDGAGGGDGLDDSGLSVGMPYVSYNNLSGGFVADLPRADGAGFSVTPASATAYSVPIWSVVLGVEGRAGKGLEQVSPTNPNPPALPGATRVLVEGVYQVPDLGPTVTDSALMAAGGFHADLKPGAGHYVSISAKSGEANLRSKGQVEVVGGDPAHNLMGKDDQTKAQVSSGDGALAALYDSSLVAVKQEKAVDPFYQLVWDDVKKPDAAGDKLKAGTYVWWQDGTLHYYDMPYASYLEHIQAAPDDPGVVPAPLPPSVKQVSDPKKAGKLVLTDSLTVESTAATDELSLVLREGAAEVPPDALGGPAPQGNDALIDSLSTSVINRGMLRKFIQTTQGVTNGRYEVWDDEGEYIGMISWNPDGQGGIVVNDSGDTNKVLNLMMNPSMYPVGNTSSNNVTAIDVQAMATMFGVTAGGPPPGEVDLPGVTDSLTASDVEIEFDGRDREVVLHSEGSIRLTGGVRGKGGSIVSGGDIRITGMGADFSAIALSNSSDGVNMYAKGDIVFNTLDKAGSEYEFRDVKLKGVVYAWGDFIANLGAPNSKAEQGTLSIEGALIAYGGDPAGAPGANVGKGRIQIAASKVRLTFDPSYVGGVSTVLPAGYKLKSTSWANNLQ